MRILFIGSKKYDYLQDAVFSGLLKLIGWKNLHTFSVYKNYILPIKKYPRNMGYNKKSILTNRLAFNHLNKYDFIILGSCKLDALTDYLGILPRIGKNTKTIFIDGGDTESIGGDFARLAGTIQQEQFEKLSFDYIFKREYLIDKTYGKNIFPCPFAINLDLIRNLAKSNYAYDVTFWAVESHTIRTEALNLIGDKFDCRENGTTIKQDFYKYKRTGNTYLQELKKARITLNFRGGGWDTLRYWEVPAIGGFMVSQKPGIVIPNNFEHEKQVVFIKDDLSNLIEVCEYYLKNEKKREMIAKRAEIHTKEFHTDIARANYLLNTITR